ncbi:hypothetical protein SEA_DARDANUS_63 [Gordonia phage Dardanus]|uniref:Uncharacterized protein n=1 Tax=Gordonia phage Dardanus TaxID=2588489 RepID=A0A514CX70_9CAUD|nr:hypothetical protein KDJ58_gp63 [Gordonia phage Dardanus]QDH85100.1 hypothetical protein SEA_DARDANUS_63 [Gordonia phage Dardanus]
MKTWTGQYLMEGHTVGRGARDGNTSTFRLGVIERLIEDKGKVRVHWLYERRTKWVGERPDREAVEYAHEVDSHGTCDVHSLFHVQLAGLDPALKGRLMQHAIKYSVALAGDEPAGARSEGTA